jgi:hypothetical protein
MAVRDSSLRRLGTLLLVCTVICLLVGTAVIGKILPTSTPIVPGLVIVTALLGIAFLLRSVNIKRQHWTLEDTVAEVNTRRYVRVMLAFLALFGIATILRVNGFILLIITLLSAISIAVASVVDTKRNYSPRKHSVQQLRYSYLLIVVAVLFWINLLVAWLRIFELL